MRHQLSIAVAMLAFVASAIGMAQTAWSQVQTSFTYDALGRLVKVERPGERTTEYTYDAAGNRLSVEFDVTVPPPPTGGGTTYPEEFGIELYVPLVFS